MGTHPSYKERKNTSWSKSIDKEKGKKQKKKVILSVLSIVENKLVITAAHALTVGPSNIRACFLLWDHPGRLDFYLLLA